MKKYCLYIGIILGLALPSCKSAIEIPEIERLELSVQEQLKISKDEQSLEVEVRTNQSDWSYIGGGDWLTLSKQGNKLLLVGSENKGLHKRHSTIVVRAGQLARTIEVTQQGTAEVLAIGSTSYQVDQWGKEIAFIVEDNLSELEVINSSSEWIKYEVNPKKQEFRIVVGENTAYEDRRAVLYLRDSQGNGSSEIVINQKGAMYHLLPYGGFNETEEEVKAFEQSRRSILTGKPTGVANPLIGGNTNIWTFETKSKAFNVIQYVIEPDERRYRSAIIWATDPALFAREKEQEKVIEFLLKEGFELRRNSTYYSKKHECQALVGVSGEGSFILYTFEPQQRKAQATFPQFPWGVIANEQWRSYDDDRVRLWEEAHGGTYIVEKENNDLRTVIYSTTELGGYLRLYTFNDNSLQYPLENVQHIFTNIEPIFFHERGATVLTREFLGLARQEQLEFDRYLDAHIFLFQHKARSLYVGAYRSVVQDFDDETKELIVAKLEFMSTQAPQSAGSLRYNALGKQSLRASQDALIREALHRVSRSKSKK